MYNEAFARASIGSPAFIKLAKTQVDFLLSILELPKRGQILDVPCGVGRHSVLFARKGFGVTGIDISEDCLKIAKKSFSHQNVRYRSGDMQDLSPFRDQFDCALNLFTSFGYFHTDQQNEDVLREMHQALKLGGKIVLNLIDRDWILKRYQPARWSESKGLLSIHTSRYDKSSKYNESHMVLLDQKKAQPQLLSHHYHRVRLYSKAEMLHLLKKVGFKKIEVYGDFSGNPYKKGSSSHPIYVGEKI